MITSTGTKIKRVHEKETQTKINDYIKGNETVKINCSKVNSMCTCIHACMHVNVYNLQYTFRFFIRQQLENNIKIERKKRETERKTLHYDKRAIQWIYSKINVYTCINACMYNCFMHFWQQLETNIEIEREREKYIHDKRTTMNKFTINVYMYMYNLQ